MKIIRTFLYITCNENILFVKKYQPIVGIHRLFHSSCCFLNTNTTTNSNSKNARSRMVASMRGSVGMGTKEDESSTGCVWAVGFHHVMACSRLARVLKLMNSLIFNFPNFFRLQ